MRGPAHLAALALAGTLLALAMPVAAQAPLCPVRAAADPGGQEHAAGATLAYDLTVASEALLTAEVSLNLTDITPGWTATLARDRFSLQPGGEGAAQVLVTAPAQGGARQAAVNVQVRAQCAGPAGQAGASTETVALSPTLAPPPAAPPPSAGALLLPALLAGIAGLALAAAWASRAKVVTLRAPQPHRDLPPGGGASFPLALGNPGRAPLAAKLEVEGLPEGWSLVAPPGEARLEPGASTTLQLLVRSPREARAGDAATLEVRARVQGQSKAPAVLLRAFVVEEGPAPGAAPPRPRPPVLVRDEAALKGERGAP